MAYISRTFSNFLSDNEMVKWVYVMCFAVKTMF